MNHRVGLDRSQTLLFPERLEDYIAAENPVRFLDAFVASLNLHALGFAKARCANTGRPPYDPAVLLKLYLYGYLHRVRSSRLLAAECQRDAVDAAEPDSAALSKSELAQKIAALRDKRDWHTELREQLDEEQKQISVTDPDTRKLPTAHGMIVGYNAQVAVDAKHKLIAAADVTNEGTDCQQLANVALAAKANLELTRTEVIADAGYYNASEVSRCVEHGITTYIPKADTSANTKLGLYGKSQFKYDAVKNEYVCAAGAALTYRFSTCELGRELQYYRATGCKACSLKSRCMRNKANRTITREANEYLMEAMAQRMRQQPGKFRLRKTLAEHPFGTIKRWFGYTHFLLKGLAKVQCEWSLTTLVYNLKRVLNLVSFQKLMAAV